MEGVGLDDVMQMSHVKRDHIKQSACLYAVTNDVNDHNHCLHVGNHGVIIGFAFYFNETCRQPSDKP